MRTFNNMKHRILLLSLLMMFAGIAYGQEYHVDVPGTLKEVMGEEAYQLRRVRVTGTINNRDLRFLHRLCWPDPNLDDDVPTDKVRLNDNECLEDLKVKLRLLDIEEDSVAEYWEDSRTKLRHLDLEDARIEGDTLADNALYQTYLVSLKLPKTLKKIGKRALRFNVILKKLVVPESVTEIDKEAFAWNIKLEEVRLPDNLEVISKDMFLNCVRLKEVNIPSRLRELQDNAFYGCEQITPTVAILPETIEILGNGVYYGVNHIEEIVIPQNVKVLNGTCWAMGGLRKAIILTDKLTEIGDFTFYGCNELEEVNIPDNITRIGYGAFWFTNLKKIHIPSTVTYIGVASFSGIEVDSLDIPAGVTFIGREAFRDLCNLRKVYARPVVPPFTYERDVYPYLPFYGSMNNAVLYVPKGSAEAYRQSEVFSGFSEIVELEEWQWSTSIHTPVAPETAYKVYGSNGMLCIDAVGNENSNPVSVNIYNISGAVVWKGKTECHSEIPLPTGFYVVQVGKDSYKIAL